MNLENHHLKDGLIEFTWTKPKWIRRFGETRRVTFLSGQKKCSDGHKFIYFGGEAVEIDCGIRSLIEELNSRGFYTVYCCSGLSEDHRPWKNHKNFGGYIAFLNAPTQLLPLMPDGLFFDGDGTWPCIRAKNTLPSYARKAAWIAFRRAVSADSRLHANQP